MALFILHWSHGFWKDVDSLWRWNAQDPGLQSGCGSGSGRGAYANKNRERPAKRIWRKQEKSGGGDVLIKQCKQQQQLAVRSKTCQEESPCKKGNKYKICTACTCGWPTSSLFPWLIQLRIRQRNSCKLYNFSNSGTTNLLAEGCCARKYTQFALSLEEHLKHSIALFIFRYLPRRVLARDSFFASPGFALAAHFPTCQSFVLFYLTIHLLHPPAQ